MQQDQSWPAGSVSVEVYPPEVRQLLPEGKKFLSPSEQYHLDEMLSNMWLQDHREVPNVARR